MSTFDIKEYIAQIAQNVLSQQTDYDFQLTEVSGLAGLEGIISGQVAYDNFIATDSTGDGYVYQQPNGGYFMRRVATVFIMRKYQYMDMVAMREEVEKCRRYFNLIVAQMVADQPNLETKLIYLNTERIVIREFEPETSAHFTGLYFMLEFSQPYSLVAAPPVPPEPEPAYIKGRIIDGARTFTFNVNRTVAITVDVDEQGNWKWLVDRIITSLQNFSRNEFLEEVIVYGIDTLTNLRGVCSEYNVPQKCTALKIFSFINCDLSNVTTISYAFTDCAMLQQLNYDETLHPTQPYYEWLKGTQITSLKPSFFRANGNLNSLSIGTYIRQFDLRQCTIERASQGMTYAAKVLLNIIPSNYVSYTATFGEFLVELTINQCFANVQLNPCRLLSKQSIFNLIAAAAANVTYTLHATVYAKCATGGEWHADIQAAIDAKAAEGFTVTLISA